MFLSEALRKAIHDDRLREIERVIRERRLLAEPDVAVAASIGRIRPAASTRPSRSVERAGSAGEPA